jgi:hypothetical protein
MWQARNRTFSRITVQTPTEKDLFDISTMDERELVELFDKTWTKAKHVKTDHWHKHGLILGCFKILNRLYNTNVHKCGRDEGHSGETLEGFEIYFHKRVPKSKN